jgi:murein DD-endopeptidase MepM/ murein hydrolase activator NlpD
LRPAPARRASRKLVPAAAAALALATAAGAAAADGGSVGAPAPPEVREVVCLETCAGVRKATEGSRVELTGRNLANVEQVAFTAAEGGRIPVEPRRVEARSVIARVPAGAATGRPRVRDAFGNADSSPVALQIVAASSIPEGGPCRLSSANAAPRKAYFDGRRDPSVTYSFSGEGPTDVRIDVVSRKDGSVVDSFTQSAREPNTQHVASWNGRTAAGRPARNGGYRFRIGPLSGGKAETTDGSRFGFYGHKFPVRARHGYGDGFGAGRGHQGQDVFARCGAKLVAARGGRVIHRDYHSAAGNYVVISGRRTKLDYMYSHLERRASVREGERVRTGEPIGTVGATGNAQGCHLHFEVWKGAWYAGGSPTPAVTRLLKRWDSWS